MSKFSDEWLKKTLAANPDLAAVNNQEPAEPQPATVLLAPAPEGSKLEQKFADLWVYLDGPELEREYRFSPPRRWKFDFAYPAFLVAIELEGGVWDQGRHTRGQGYIDDCVKYNAAALLGWKVFRLATGMVTEEHVRPIAEYCMGYG